METIDIWEDKRKFRRISPSKEDCIYCLVAKKASTFKPLSLVAADISENGFRFTMSPGLSPFFGDGEKLFLKGIRGSVDITFAEPVELTTRWLKSQNENGLIDIGFEILDISEASKLQLSEFIRADLLGFQKIQNLQALIILSEDGPNGNIAKIVGWIEESCRLKNYSVKRIKLSGLRINGCRKCLKCKSNSKKPGCVQKDDVLYILDQMLNSDLVMFASPLYHRFLSVEMRSLFERFNCLFRGTAGAEDHTAFNQGQLQSLIMTSTHHYEAHADQIVKSFQAMLRLQKAHSAGKFIICNCTRPDHLGDQIKQQSQAFVDQLTLSKPPPYAVLFFREPTPQTRRESVESGLPAGVKDLRQAASVL